MDEENWEGEDDELGAMVRCGWKDNWEGEDDELGAIESIWRCGWRQLRRWRWVRCHGEYLKMWWREGEGDKELGGEGEIGEEMGDKKLKQPPLKGRKKKTET